MNATRSPGSDTVSGPDREQAPTPAASPAPVFLRLGPDDVAVLHRSIPVLVDRVRQQLA
jgi:hypothetical protein